MIIISDCLTEKIDEGCLKVANSLTKRIKQADSDTMIVSYNRKPLYSDVHLSLNKLFFNKELISILRKKKESVFYIPFASNTTASCFRTFVLSVFSGRKVSVLFALRFPMNRIAKALLRMSGANVIALSEPSYQFYKELVGEHAKYLKTGIDTGKFVPVDFAKVQELREKYHIPTDKKVLLHVGHMKSGRNVDKLAYAEQQYHIVLVVSSVTETESDISIRRKLEERGSVTIIDSYLEDIQEVYQMSDVYVFPIQQTQNCIDVPLSVLEAASCNIPIVTTEYGELVQFKGHEGFCFVDKLTPETLNQALEHMTAAIDCQNREAIGAYDWERSIEILKEIM